MSLFALLLINFFDRGIRSPCLPYHPPISGRGVPSWKRQGEKLLETTLEFGSAIQMKKEETPLLNSHKDPLCWYQYITKQKKSLFKVDLSTAAAEGETNEEPPDWWTPCGCWNLKLSSLRLLLLWYQGISRKVDSVDSRPELWRWLSRGGCREPAVYRIYPREALQGNLSSRQEDRKCEQKPQYPPSLSLFMCVSLVVQLL